MPVIYSEDKLDGSGMNKILSPDKNDKIDVHTARINESKVKFKESK